MAVAKFEDHCWKDVVTPEILETYIPYHRDTYIGQRPALFRHGDDYLYLVMPLT